MNHLFFASQFEAQPFLKDSMVQLSDSPLIYEGEFRIIIIGSGLVDAAANTTAYLTKLEIKPTDNFINLGIAGATTTSHKVGSVHEVSRAIIYCAEYIPETSLNIWHQSYPDLPVQDEGLILATSLHPIWGGKFIPTLRIKKAALVDMEGYAFLRACKNFNITPKMYKSVSDNLMKESQNQFLKDAGIAIEKLYKFYTNL